jgi:hypothetical protein
MRLQLSMQKSTIIALLLFVGVVGISQAKDALPSWNDGPARRAILDFVQTTTTEGGPDYVAPEARIATFDQDGTLWVEHPMYSQVMYCLERVPAIVQAKPELKDREPFKTVMSGNREAIARISMKDLEVILAATLTGMSVEEFEREVKKWIASAKDPRWKRPNTELTYQPMQEMLTYHATTASRLISSPAAARTLCASIPTRPTASRRNR